jgi:hypothetical protein
MKTFPFSTKINNFNFAHEQQPINTRQLRDAIVLACKSLEQQMIQLVPLTQWFPMQDVVYVQEDILSVMNE